MKKILIPIVCILPLFVIGCSKLIPSYRIPVQQGNIISQYDINRVRMGMTKKQIGFVLGTPLIRDAFNQDRWDYIYTLNHGRRKGITKRVSVLFSNDKVVGVEGDLKPQHDPNAEKRNKTVIVDIDPGKKKKKGVFGRIFGRKRNSR